MIPTSRWPQPKLARCHRFTNYNYQCVHLWLHIFSVSSRVWQATEVAPESSTEKNLNEGPLYLGVTESRERTRAPLALKRQGGKCITEPRGSWKLFKKGLLSRSCCHWSEAVTWPRAGRNREKYSHLPFSPASASHCGSCPAGKEAWAQTLASWDTEQAEKGRKQVWEAEKKRVTRVPKNTAWQCNQGSSKVLWFKFLPRCVAEKYQHTVKGRAETHFQVYF